MLCPGEYCGVLDGNISDVSLCAACPWGFRARDSLCQACTSPLAAYDWMYLGFMFFLPLILHCVFIDIYANRSSWRLLLLHLSAFVECFLSALFSLLTSRPVGQLTLHSCGVTSIQDWYTVFYNPSLKPLGQLHCTQEAVYPLYTIVMIYFALQIPLMLIRPLFFANRWIIKPGIEVAKPVYSALYFLPVLTALHVVAGGILYYCYGYVTLLISVVSLSIYLSHFEAQDAYSLIKRSLCNGRSVVILTVHCILHGYGILSFVGFQNIVLSSVMLLLMPVPFLFYVLTSRFTCPNRVENFNSEGPLRRCCS